MLSEHRIQVVEFEYNSRVGYWHPRFQERRTLNTTLGLLGVCVWVGGGGGSAPPDGALWRAVSSPPPHAQRGTAD